MRRGNATVRAGRGQSRGLMALRPGPYPCTGAGRDPDTSSVPLNKPRSARQLHSSPSGKERSKFPAWSGFQMCGSTWDAESQQSPWIWRALSPPDNSSSSLGTPELLQPLEHPCWRYHPSLMDVTHCKLEMLFKLFLRPKAEGENFTPQSLRPSYQIYLSCF